MASTTHIDCDVCGRSIPDPGRLFVFDLDPEDVKDGTRYMATGGDRIKFDLCESCVSDLMGALRRAWPRAELP